MLVLVSFLVASCVQEFQLNTSVEKMLTEMDADQDGCVDFLEFTLILSQDSERSSEIFRYISNGEKLLSVDQLLRYTKVISQTWFVPESVIKRICESFVQEGISALNFEQFQQLVIERITMFQVWLGSAQFALTCSVWLHSGTLAPQGTFPGRHHWKRAAGTRIQRVSIRHVMGRNLQSLPTIMEQ